MEMSIDIETYSDVPIEYGVHKYSADTSFEVLLVAYAFNGGAVHVVDLTRDKLPSEVVQALHDKRVTKTAFNANFERVCLRRLFPAMDLEGWECTQVLALYNSLPASLDGVAKALGLYEQKDARGSALIRFFSLPQKATKSNGYRTRNRPEDAPEKWREYIEYNRQDVAVEMAIRERLKHNKPSEEERRLWLLDSKINSRGVAVDLDLARHAIAFGDRAKNALNARIGAITGLANPNSPAQLTPWLVERLGESIPGITKSVMAELLDRDDIPKDVRQVLELREKAAKTSVKKYSFIAGAATAGRIHGMLQFYGAARTGRWAGRGVQLQNLPRNYLEDLDTPRELIRSGDYDTLALLYDNVPDVLSQLIRTALVPSEGARFIVADYSAIEARVIAWLAGESWRLDVFNTTGKIYEASASMMFGVPVELIKKGREEYALRQKGKVAELALGYGGGVNALVAMGALRGGIHEEELPDIVAKWRKASPAIVKLWRTLERAAMKAIATPGARVEAGRVSMARVGDDLYIKLPSGRRLVYRNARLGVNRFGNPSIIYEGNIQSTGKIGPLETYGGKLCENITQAVARDVLAEAMTRLDSSGYDIVAHVHDEIIIDAPKGFGSLADVIEVMCTLPTWAKGLPLNAAGFEASYYMKD